MLWKRVVLASRSTPTTVRLYGGGSREFRSRRVIPVWDRVLPSLWHPMSSLEQSLMEMEEVGSRMLAPRSPLLSIFSSHVMPSLYEDEDEFFKDLPIQAPREAITRESSKVETAAETNTKIEPATVEGAAEKQKQQQQQQPAYYSSYAYSYSTVLDKKGHRIGTVRRRYEDSTGRLKALHEREMDGKKLRMVWQRADAEDKGEHQIMCTSGTAEEFEKEWGQTPFGRAEDERQAKELEASENHRRSAFGEEYTPEKVSEEHHTTPAPAEETKEHDKEREETIQKAAKCQEEETTPPQYT